VLSQTPKSLLAAAIAVTLMAAAARGAPAAKEDAAGLHANLGQTRMSVLDGQRYVLIYHFRGGAALKPYIQVLSSPAGVQILRDSPSDHQHHHALMFATAVDGVDFWGEVGQGFGKELHRSFVISKWTIRDNVDRAGFVEQLDWVGPASKKPLLAEARTLKVFNAPDLGATLIEWQSTLQTPPGKKTAVLTGDHYFGLGMRFLQSMDTGGRFFNADDKPGEIVRGDERLTPVKWCAYTAKADGKPVTVAVFDHPANLRHPAKMFTMTKPFAYLSATRNERKEPITIKAGKPLDLRYGVAVWDGEVDKKAVEKLYQRWLKLSSYK